VAHGAARIVGVEAIAAFLDPSHVALAARLADIRDRHFSSPDPEGDDDARRRARESLALLGSEDLLTPAAGGDLRALCLTREALAFGSPLVDSVVAVQALAATTIQLAGRGDQLHWVEDMTRGRMLGAFAMSEPGAGSDVAAIQTSARRDGDDWVLDGEKHLITNAGIADLYVTFAATRPGAGSSGLSVFLVPADATGLGIIAQRTSVAHPLGRVSFSGCRLPGEALLGEVDNGFRIGMTTLDRIRPSVGASACGMAARALVASLEHAAIPRLSGGTVGDLGLIREKLGRMATDFEAARLLTYRAAWLGDRDGGRITVEAAMAKSFATETAQHIVDDAVQIAGGVGLLAGHPAERLYRAVRAARIYEGTTEIQRLIVAGALLGRHSVD
jgi:acyl-CoA dehydrogenase